MAKKFDPKAKAKRQKIIAGVLGLVLVGVLAFQAPTILSAFGGGSSGTASESSPAPTPVPVSPAPPAAAAGVPAAVAPVPTDAALVDTDPALPPADGQLVAFDQFESKDPFVQQVDDTAAGPSTAGSGGPGKKASNPADPAADRGTPKAGRKVEEPVSPAPAPAPRVATIAVNGDEQRVSRGGTFPEGDPMFKLVAVKSDSVKIGIAGGSYANGSHTITLREGGKPVTLMNTADGTSYVLRLLSVA